MRTADASCRAVSVAWAAAFSLAPIGAAAAPVLRDADVSITMTSATSCAVAMVLTLEKATEIDHRIEAFPGSRVELVSVRGATQVGAVREIGRTRSLVLRPAEATYELRYRAQQTAARSDRCPLWLPIAPTDGRAGAVRLRVDLPPTAVPGNSLPAFQWTGARGSATLGHLPAFVHLPYRSGSDSAPWDAGRVMDAVAVATFAGASVFWVWRRRR